VNDEVVKMVYLEKGPIRLDRFLVENLPDYSRSRLQAFIKDRRVKVNSQIVQKTGYTLEGGEEVQVLIPEKQPVQLIAEDIPLDVIFENDDLLVVNKPAGMVVHPAAGNITGTLVHAALAHAPEMEGIGGEQRPGIVHRLDKNTSGLIILAKNDPMHRWLVNRFRDRKVKKIYLALVDGAPPTPTGRIETPIGRSSSDRKKMAVVPPSHGRESITEFRTVETYSQHTLLEVHPITGRTHQIRIHMNYVGCPVAGDTVYGRRHPTIPIGRHCLHAARLVIQLPGEKTNRTFEAPLPPDLKRVIETLRSRR
jgi:23S rRNA pseudouridine1911/1915/1917 synthase